MVVNQTVINHILNCIRIIKTVDMETKFCFDDQYIKVVQFYRGEVEVESCRMKKYFNKPLRMTNDDEENFQKADQCCIFYRKYVEKDIRARDRCHITEKYKGSAH